MLYMRITFTLVFSLDGPEGTLFGFNLSWFIAEMKIKPLELEHRRSHKHTAPTIYQGLNVTVLPCGIKRP